MKTSEFKKKIEALNFKTYEDEYNLAVRSCDKEEPFVYVGKRIVGDLETNMKALNYKDNNVKKAVKLAVDYAFTPIKERGDELKFYVRLTPFDPNNYDYWLNDSNHVEVVIRRKFATQFTVADYCQLLANNPEWRPFLHDYDPDNTDVFVPVEADNE